MAEHVENPEAGVSSESQLRDAANPTASVPTSRISPTRISPKPPTSPRVHPAVWMIRVVLVLTEPLRTMGRLIRYLLEEPRYVGDQPGRVAVRRSLAEGLWREALWHPRQGAFGGFAWGDERHTISLAHAILVDYLGEDAPERLCIAFARRVFAHLTHRDQSWTLTTLQVERALRLALVETRSENHAIAA